MPLLESRLMPPLPIGVTVAAGVDETSALVMVIAAAVAAVIVLAVSPRVTIPVVVLELVLGIVIGPQGFDIARVDPTTSLLGDLGLGMLFFFAGYEIDFDRIKGRPLELAVIGWAISLALAYGIGGALASAGIILSFLYTGSAMATTAIGTLIPILSDAGEMRTRFGTYLLGAGAIGEFGPILLVTLILSTGHPLHEAVILIIFIVLAVFTGLLAVRSAWRGWPLVEKTFETSSQLAVRLAVVLVFSLVALAAQLGLDLLLGGFVAGMITRIALRGREVSVFDSKLTAVGYGLLIPFFFVTSGMAFNLDALTSSVVGAAQGADVRRALPGRPGSAGAAPLSQRARPAGPVRPRRLLRDRAAARRRDHHARDRRRPHEELHGRRTGRRGDHLHADLPAARVPASGAAASPWRGRSSSPPPPSRLIQTIRRSLLRPLRLR